MPEARPFTDERIGASSPRGRRCGSFRPAPAFSSFRNKARCRMAGWRRHTGSHCPHMVDREGAGVRNRAWPEGAPVRLRGFGLGRRGTRSGRPSPRPSRAAAGWTSRGAFDFTRPGGDPQPCKVHLFARPVDNGRTRGRLSTTVAGENEGSPSGHTEPLRGFSYAADIAREPSSSELARSGKHGSSGRRDASAQRLDRSYAGRYGDRQP
jgi:hypothetical protein